MNTARYKAELLAIRSRIDSLLEEIDRDPDAREQSPWMNTPEYARHARVGTDTVRRWIDEGMPHTGQSRLLRIHRDEADQWRKNSVYSGAKTRAAG